MSRIGNYPIEMTEGVKVDIKGGFVYVSGPKGKLSKAFSDSITATIEDGKIILQRKDDDKKTKALHGLTRSLVSNMVKGVSEGYTKTLEIVGVGYRAEMSGDKTIKFNLGYSNPVDFNLPEGITAQVEERGTRLILGGIDKEVLGQTAAKIKMLRLPDSYKGKGIRYSGETLKLKPGKAGGKK